MAYPRDVSIADAIKSYYQLPQTHRVHWSKARKDQVVRAVRSQAISLHEARERYLLSVRRHGVDRAVASQASQSWAWAFSRWSG